MSVVIIELNDADIRVGSGREIVLRSPGYAITENDKIEVGIVAARQARLNPRAVYDRYWSNLNQDPLQSPTDYARHHADLAYAHLLALHEQAGKPDEVLFAVPGNFSNDQLALLLGLVEASPFQKTVGLVDVAVAAAAPVVPAGSCVHLDLHLHHVVLTNLVVADQVTRGEVQIIEGVGRAEMFDRCASAIADVFIAQTRFDPQHHAETEQMLYDQIPQCFQTLGQSSEATIEMQYRGTQYQTKITGDLVREALNPLYTKIAAALDGETLNLVGDRLAGLPGFLELLPNTQALPETSVMDGCQSHLLKIHSAGPTLDFVTSLPANDKIAAAPESAAVPVQSVASEPKATPVTRTTPATRATHLMYEHRAYRLGQAPLYLSLVDGVSKTKTAQSSCQISQRGEELLAQVLADDALVLNGQRLQGQAPLQRGDVIAIVGTGVEYRLIHVMD
jgi:hypothetical protein